MKKIFRLLGRIPFLILVVYAIILLLKVANNEILLQWRHIAGLIFLVVTGVFFFKKYEFGIIALGITILSGFFGLLSFSPAISTSTLYTGNKIPIFYCQPVFFWWALLHFSISGKLYIGIGTKKYWYKLLKNTANASK